MIREAWREEASRIKEQFGREGDSILSLAHDALVLLAAPTVEPSVGAHMTPCENRRSDRALLPVRSVSRNRRISVECLSTFTVFRRGSGFGKQWNS